MNFLDGELINFITSKINEEIQPCFNINRPEKLFFESENYFIKVNYSNYVDEMRLQINKTNSALVNCEFYDAIQCYNFSKSLIQITPKLEMLYVEFGNGEYNLRKYFYEKLVDDNYLSKIKNISRDLWKIGFIHLDIIKSFGISIKKREIKLFDCECIMDYNTYITTINENIEIRNFSSENLWYHDEIFFNRLKNLVFS